MAIYDYLPTYHQVEASNLKGLQAGLVISQVEIDPTATSLLTDGMFENGHICGIGPNGIVAANKTTDTLFIHFSEPLNTTFRGEKYFAIDPKNECGRLVQLMPGDEWVSDAEIDDELADRIIKIDGEVWNTVRLPDGTPAHHYRYIGGAVSGGGSSYPSITENTNDVTISKNLKLTAGITLSNNKIIASEGSGNINIFGGGKLLYNEVELAKKNDFSGINDGTNWTTITINGVTKNIPAGGSALKVGTYQANEEGEFVPAEEETEEPTLTIQNTELGYSQYEEESNTQIQSFIGMSGLTNIIRENDITTQTDVQYDNVDIYRWSENDDGYKNTNISLNGILLETNIDPETEEVLEDPKTVELNYDGLFINGEKVGGGDIGEDLADIIMNEDIIKFTVNGEPFFAISDSTWEDMIGNPILNDENLFGIDGWNVVFKNYNSFKINGTQVEDSYNIIENGEYIAENIK